MSMKFDCFRIVTRVCQLAAVILVLRRLVVEWFGPGWTRWRQSLGSKPLDPSVLDKRFDLLAQGLVATCDGQFTRHGLVG